MRNLIYILSMMLLALLASMMSDCSPGKKKTAPVCAPLHFR